MVKIWNKIASLSAAMLMMSLIIAPVCKVNAASDSLNGSLNTPKAGTVKEETTTTTDVDPNTLDKDELIAMTKETLKDSGGEENSRITVKDDCIIIDFWYEGMNLVIDAAATNSTYKNSYDYMVESLRDASEQLYGPYEKFNMDVYLNFVDEDDHDKPIFICKNGKVIYDKVNEVDLRTDDEKAEKTEKTSKKE